MKSSFNLPPTPIPTRQILILLVPQPYLPSHLLVFFSLFNSKESNYLSFHAMPSHWVCLFLALLYCCGLVWISEKPELHCHKLKKNTKQAMEEQHRLQLELDSILAPSTVRGNIQDFNFTADIQVVEIIENNTSTESEDSVHLH